MPPYNSSAIYEDNMLPVYVDYIGNILPILDRQSIAASWPPTPHPMTGQVRYMPYNSANMPTVPYIMGVGSQLLPPLIRGASVLSEVASEKQPGLQGDSVSQIGVSLTQTPTTIAISIVTLPPSRQGALPATTLYEPVRSVAGISTTKSEQLDDGKPSLMVKDLPPVDMEQTVPYIDQAQRDIPFTDFIIPINPPVRVSTVYVG